MAPGSAVNSLYFHVAGEGQWVRDPIASEPHRGVSQQLDAKEVSNGVVLFVQNKQSFYYFSRLLNEWNIEWNYYFNWDGLPAFGIFVSSLKTNRSAFSSSSQRQVR